MTKKAIDLYKEGVVPHIQIHDELDISVESDEAANKIINIMENAVSLKVPNKVDYESVKLGVIFMDKIVSKTDEVYVLKNFYQKKMR